MKNNGGLVTLTQSTTALIELHPESSQSHLIVLETDHYSTATTLSHSPPCSVSQMTHIWLPHVGANPQRDKISYLQLHPESSQIHLIVLETDHYSTATTLSHSPPCSVSQMMHIRLPRTPYFMANRTRRGC